MLLAEFPAPMLDIAHKRGRVRATVGDGRSHVYRFPPLAECREQFDELIQHKIDWGSPGRGFFDIDEWEKDPPARPVRQ